MFVRVHFIWHATISLQANENAKMQLILQPPFFSSLWWKRNKVAKVSPRSLPWFTAMTSLLVTISNVSAVMLLTSHPIKRGACTFNPTKPVFSLLKQTEKLIECKIYGWETQKVVVTYAAYILCVPLSIEWNPKRMIILRPNTRVWAIKEWQHRIQGPSMIYKLRTGRLQWLLF